MAEKNIAPAVTKQFWAGLGVDPSRQIKSVIRQQAKYLTDREDGFSQSDFHEWGKIVRDFYDHNSHEMSNIALVESFSLIRSWARMCHLSRTAVTNGLHQRLVQNVCIFQILPVCPDSQKLRVCPDFKKSKQLLVECFHDFSSVNGRLRYCCLYHDPMRNICTFYQPTE